jgi:hypothetical protein
MRIVREEGAMIFAPRWASASSSWVGGLIVVIVIGLAH